MKTRPRSTPMALAALAILATAAFGAPVAGQAPQGTDARWLPFVGCWEAVGGEEDVGLLCFRLEGQGAVLTNYVDGAVASTERLVADGSRQQVSVEGCEGWESVQFSEDGRRAFTTTEFTCGTDETRTGSGVMTFLAQNTWADIRTLQAGDEPFAWVQEYRLAGADRIADQGVPDPAQGLGMAVRTARAAAAATLDLDDVIEASQRMDAKAVETWLVTKRDNFRPTGSELVALADAGVAEEVIDAVVAVSNPDRFLVEADGPVEEYEGRPRPTHYRGYMAFNPFWGPVWGASYGYYGYGYAPYGYGGWGYPGYGYRYWGYRPGYVIVAPRAGSSGRVYNGRGYSGSGSSGGRAARPRGNGGTPNYSVGGSRATSGGARPSSGGARPRSGGAPSRPSAVRRPSGGSSTPSAARRPSGGSSTPSAARRPSGSSGAVRGASPRPARSSQPASAPRRAQRRPGGSGG